MYLQKESNKEQILKFTDIQKAKCAISMKAKISFSAEQIKFISISLFMDFLYYKLPLNIIQNNLLMRYSGNAAAMYPKL